MCFYKLVCVYCMLLHAHAQSIDKGGGAGYRELNTTTTRCVCEEVLKQGCIYAQG